MSKSYKASIWVSIVLFAIYFLPYLLYGVGVFYVTVRYLLLSFLLRVLPVFLLVILSSCVELQESIYEEVIDILSPYPYAMLSPDYSFLCSTSQSQWQTKYCLSQD